MSLGRTSRKRLHQCHPDLIRLFEKIAEAHNITILTGARSRDEQDRMYEMGRSKVKWPNGMHNINTPKGRTTSWAVDASPHPIPFEWGKDWKDRVKFYQLAAIVFHVAAEMNLTIRWGGDWDGDGDYKDQTFDDLLHFEIVSG
jgi:peptidoglycan L-alanyl-D-glutamate endopeptidase CwlK